MKLLQAQVSEGEGGEACTSQGEAAASPGP